MEKISKEQMEELAKELQKRGTAEISDGFVTQVTQALNETDTEADYIIFGERQKQKIIPIDEACAKCDFWKKINKTILECQAFQKQDAVARGFNKVICPEQFVSPS